MRRSAFQLADLRLYGKLKNPTNRQFDTMALALRKQRDEALKYRALYEAEQKKATAIQPQAPHASQRLFLACQEMIAQRKRMRLDVWEGTYGQIRAALDAMHSEKR